MSEQQMTPQEAATHLEITQLNQCWRSHRTREALLLAIKALRGEQPCEWENRYKRLKRNTLAAICRWSSKAIAREKQCAEWEKAWENMSHRLFVKYGRGFLQETIDAFDPRRKQAEEKPTDYNDIFASPESLNRFLDETNFDAYHTRPRAEYFPMLRKPEQAEEKPQRWFCWNSSCQWDSGYSHQCLEAKETGNASTLYSCPNCRKPLMDKPKPSPQRDGEWRM